MLTNIFLAIGMASAMGLGVVNTQNHDFIVNDNPSNVVYDDEEYSITFTSYELQEYTWVNLCNIVGNGTNIYRTTNFLGENDDEYIYDEYVIEDGTYALYYINGDNQITLNQSNLKNRFIFYLENEIADFGENYTWNLNSTIYDDIKQAIELDIQANAPAQSSMGNSIISAITSGLGLIGDLASEFLAGFTALFWVNNSLTTFGTFALVMLGVAITMAVVSLVLKLIRGNTGA